MLGSASLAGLMDAFKQLPGIGAKTAMRLSLYLLERNREGANNLSLAIDKALREIKHCQQCNNYSDTPICSICSNTKRDHTIAVVESPVDVYSIEQSGSYFGRYFVLMGHLSPLDGISPDDLNIPKLISEVQNNGIQEVILATNSTVEGEATAFYISEQLAKVACKTSRLALGIPIGGELEYLDSGTLAHALQARRPIVDECM